MKLAKQELQDMTPEPMNSILETSQLMRLSRKDWIERAWWYKSFSLPHLVSYHFNIMIPKQINVGRKNGLDARQGQVLNIRFSRVDAKIKAAMFVG